MENGKSRLEQVQDEVEEVRVIMLDNLNKSEERTEKLSDLDERAEELVIRSKTFEKTSVQVKESKRLENKRMKGVFIAIGVVAGLVILGLIIFAIIG